MCVLSVCVLCVRGKHVCVECVCVCVCVLSVCVLCVRGKHVCVECVCVCVSVCAYVCNGTRVKLESAQAHVERVCV